MQCESDQFILADATLLSGDAEPLNIAREVYSTLRTDLADLAPHPPRQTTRFSAATRASESLANALDIYRNVRRHSVRAPALAATTTGSRTPLRRRRGSRRNREALPVRRENARDANDLVENVFNPAD